jgi:hypothetical protein
MERLLWRMGYYTRVEARLSEPSIRRSSGAARALDLTDVDVFGVRYGEDLQARRVLVDCKSGRNVSPIGRAFWLRGVMDHLGGHVGYVVMARDIPRHQREASSRLGVSLLREADLVTLEARYPPCPGAEMVGDVGTYGLWERGLASLPKDLALLKEFRSTAFWYYRPPRAVMSAIAVTRRAGSQLDPTQRFHRALVADVICLFALALLDLGAEFIRLHPDNLLEALRASFFGGPEGIARRESILKTLQDVLHQATAQGRLPLLESERLDLDPPYLPRLADLLIRATAKPLEASQVPRHLKLTLTSGVLHDRWDFEAKGRDTDAEITAKLASDFGLAFLKVAELAPDFGPALHFR